MTTNGVCTVARACEDKNVITWQGDCMWQEVRAYEVKKYGEERADRVTVFIPDISADIAEGDCIICGDADADRAVHEGLTVMSVSRNAYGSADMQHIEVGAR